MSNVQHPTAARRWCDALQEKLMDAIDAAWAMAEGSDDPAVLARARDRARMAGHIAGMARKVLALDPPQARATALPGAIRQALDRLAPASPAESGKPPAAQAVAMRAAFQKLKRR